MYYSKQIIEGEIVSVESKSVRIFSPNFFQATKAEYDNFIASLPLPIIKPVRDLEKELDNLIISLKLNGVID